MIIPIHVFYILLIIGFLMFIMGMLIKKHGKKEPNKIIFILSVIFMIIGTAFLVYINIAKPNCTHDHHSTDKVVSISYLGESSKDGYITIGPKRNYFYGTLYDVDISISTTTVYEATDEYTNKCVYYVRSHDYSLGPISIYGYGEYAQDLYLDNNFYEKYIELTTAE